MTVFLLIVFGLYFAGLMALWFGWSLAMRTPEPTTSPTTPAGGGEPPIKITVVIPFRNEEKNIANLIRDLQDQQVNGRLPEIIMVDDHSTDLSLTIAKGLTGAFPEFKILQLPPSEEGKKRAILKAITASKGNIIVTTDADCRLPGLWLSSIEQSFQDEKTKMIFGGVRIRDTGSFFSRLQAMEFCSLIGTGASTAALGVPLLCNGASLAYRKSAFVEVEGFEGNMDVASGDDEFLMHKIHRRFPGSIRFLPDSDAVIETVSQESIRDFVNQRLRWAGKWKRSGSFISRIVAVSVLVINVSFVAAWFVIPLGWSVSSILPPLLLIATDKLLLEYFLFLRVGKFLQVKINLLYFWFLMLVYPFYVGYIGIASLLVSPRWKGRL